MNRESFNTLPHYHITTLLVRIPLLLLILSILSVSCGNRRQQVLNEGDYVASDSVTVLHWKEYMDRDSFFREVTSGNVIINKARSKSQQDFADSTFAETDFYENGKPKATRNFESGKQTGIWNTWYEDGKTKSKSMID